MVIGALTSAVFFFAYTQVRNYAQNLVINVYYATLYAYTPEVQPTAHRGTGNGIAISFNRIMGILSAVVATEADVRQAERVSSFFSLVRYLADFVLCSHLDVQHAAHCAGCCFSSPPLRTICST